MNSSEGVYVRPRYPVVYFEGVNSKSLDGVQSEEQQCQEDVYKIRERLAMLIAGNPKDMMSEDDWEEYAGPTAWITAQLNEIEEDLQYTLRKYGKLELLEEMLYEWENSLFSTKQYETIFEDVNISKLSEKATNIVFPEEKFANNTNEKMMVSMGAAQPIENSFEEMFNDGMKNIDLDEPYRDIINNLYIATVDGKIFTTYSGQCMFKSEEEAFEAIKHRLNVSIHPYASTKYIKEHPEFYVNSVFKYLGKDDVEFMKPFIKDSEKLGTIISKSYSKFYDLLQKAYNKFLMSKIKIVKISEIGDFKN